VDGRALAGFENGNIFSLMICRYQKSLKLLQEQRHDQGRGKLSLLWGVMTDDATTVYGY
jgi:hypothetical protein